MDAAAERARLERECQVFARVLAGARPSAWFVAKYLQAHACGAVQPSHGIGGFDRTLLALARLGALGARAADAHASVLDRGGLLRHKLVLALALLESAAESAGRVDTPTVASTAGFAVGAGLRAGGWLFLFLVGLAPLLFVRAVCALVAPRARTAAPGTAP